MSEIGHIMVGAATLSAIAAIIVAGGNAFSKAAPVLPTNAFGNGPMTNSTKPELEAKPTVDAFLKSSDGEVIGVLALDKKTVSLTDTVKRVIWTTKGGEVLDLKVER